MSKGRKSAYPERPFSKRRSKPKGSEHISGRRKIWFEKSQPRREKVAEAKLVPSLCIYGHNPPAMTAFIAKYGHNRVPVHTWGKNGRA